VPLAAAAHEDPPALNWRTCRGAQADDSARPRAHVEEPAPALHCALPS